MFSKNSILVGIIIIAISFLGALIQYKKADIDMTILKKEHGDAGVQAKRDAVKDKLIDTLEARNGKLDSSVNKQRQSLNEEVNKKLSSDIGKNVSPEEQRREVKKESDSFGMDNDDDFLNSKDF